MAASWIVRGLCALSIAVNAVMASPLEAQSRSSNGTISPKVFLIDLVSRQSLICPWVLADYQPVLVRRWSLVWH